MEYLGSISDSKSHVTKEYVDDAIDKKADKDGVYPDMTVGMTRDMLGVGEGDEGEFLFRPTDGDGSIKDGFASIERIEGNSVVCNQIAPETGWHTTGNATVTEQNGTYVISFEDASSRFLAIINWNPSHKYIASAKITSDKEGTFFLESDIGWQQISKSVPANTPTIVEGFFNSGTSSGLNLFQICTSGPFAMTVVIDQIKLIDLTRMFGVGNEPSTIEEFYQRIPKGIDINAYNEGEVVNMNVEGIKSVGFNLWDGDATIEDSSDTPSYAVTMEESVLRTMKKIMFLSYQGNAIRYTCDVQGQIQGQRIGAMMLYKNGTLVAEILPNLGDICINLFADIEDILNADSCIFYGMSLSKWKVSNICIHLVHTGYRNGEYEPHVSDEIALPIADYFPNGMNSIGNVKDELTATEAIQRIGVVDMGTLEWSYFGGYECYSANMPSDYKVGSLAQAAGICSRYIVVSQYELTVTGTDKAISGNNNQVVFIRDTSFTDASSFKAAMSGVMLYYELAEPIVTSIDKPLALDYQVWDFGTEEAIAEGKTTPLKASIVYEFNARDTIRANKLALKNKADKAELNSLNERVTALEEEGGSSVTVDTELSETSENAISNSAVTRAMAENEEVTAAALNELNERVNEISENVSGETATKVELQTAVESLTNTILENEEVTAAALNDLNTRLNEILTRLNNAGI